MTRGASAIKQARWKKWPECYFCCKLTSLVTTERGQPEDPSAAVLFNLVPRFSPDRLNHENREVRKVIAHAGCASAAAVQMRNAARVLV